ncbi:hypothetical protein CsatB_001411 [Cannabis sativa]
MAELAILQKDIARVSRRQKGDDSNSDCEDREPCAKHILEAELPQKFKMPEIAAYTGNSDPSDHLSRFNRVRTVMRVSNDAKCLCFPLTLSGSVEEWFKKLEPGSVDCWNKLQTSFRRQFVTVRKVNLEVSALTNIKQLPTETLKNFIKRFKEEASKTKKVDNEQQLALLQAGIRYVPGAHLPGTLPAVAPPMSGIQFSATPGYSQGQALAPASSHFGNPSGMNGQAPSHSAPAASLAGPSQGSRSKRSSKGSNRTKDKRQKRGYTAQYTQYTELMDCQERDEIKNLIRLGHLYEWIKNQLPHLNPVQAGGALPQGAPGGVAGALAPVALPRDAQHLPSLPPRPNGRVAMISGGLHIRGTTRKELKRYAGAVKHDEVLEVTQLPAQRPWLMDQPITFTEEDAKTARFPHHDPLVIETPIANKIVARVLIDNGSSVNLLFKEAFTTIGLTDRDLSPSAYNAILGRSTLVDFGAVTSIWHLCLKFPTQEAGIGTVRGIQGEARQCYNIAAHLPDLMVREIIKSEMAKEDELDPRVGFEKIVE